MTKLNYVFIVSVIAVLIGAILADTYGMTYTSGILMVFGLVCAVFSGIFSIGEDSN
jgi:hypothetical protein